MFKSKRSANNKHTFNWEFPEALRDTLGFELMLGVDWNGCNIGITLAGFGIGYSYDSHKYF